jgi:hypothetical protein
MSSYRIEAPHFVAGIETEIRPTKGETSVAAAPILRWAVGKSMDEFLRYTLRRGWKVDALADR